MGSPLLNIEFMETLITEITNIFFSGKSSPPPPPHLEMLKVLQQYTRFFSRISKTLTYDSEFSKVLTFI